MAVVSLDSVLQRVARATERVRRDPTSVTVVTVCKGRSDGQVMGLFESGHRDFAENRAQALSRRATVLPPEIRWHFVGPLQTNKVRLVRPVCHLLHSLDRTALIESSGQGTRGSSLGTARGQRGPRAAKGGSAARGRRRSPTARHRSRGRGDRADGDPSNARRRRAGASPSSASWWRCGTHWRWCAPCPSFRWG